MAVAKKQIRQIISENNFNRVADLYALLKDGFKDILQELMEAELDAARGYEKIKRESADQQQKKRVFFQNFKELVWRIPSGYFQRPQRRI